jgi:hypothetical protein
MDHQWFCLDCNKATDLNRFGTCDKCLSDAVTPDRAENRILEQFPWMRQESYSQWLERLAREAAQLAHETKMRQHEQARRDMLEHFSGVNETDETV